METLDAVSIGAIVSVIVQILKRPELDYGWLKYIKTGKIALFVVSLIAVAIYGIFTGKSNALLTNWRAATSDYIKIVSSAFVVYKTVIEQIGI